MIVPPDMDELARRLRSRGTESEEKVAGRLARAGYELSKRSEYDYCVVNDSVDRAAAEILQIIADRKEVS